MPTYTYYCNECELQVERKSTIEDRNAQRCATCSNVMDKLIDRPGWIWAPTRKIST
jgi:putative FmdB family regulatory protein